MNRKVGFIGAGKMAQAMLEGMVKSNIVARENIMASAATKKTTRYVQEMYDISTTTDNKDVARFAEILILAVKPDRHAGIIAEIKDEINSKCIVVTIAAGITLTDMETAFNDKVKVVRTMPNTPSFVGAGMSVICPNKHINEDEIIEVESLFQTFGKTERLSESLMDAVPAISGSSPAYIYMFIEALADGGVQQGIPRDIAYRLAAQAVLGAAKMVIDTGVHPGILKDNVCTPGGATIAAIAELEKKQLRGTVLSAMAACTERVKTLN